MLLNSSRLFTLLNDKFVLGFSSIRPAGLKTGLGSLLDAEDARCRALDAPVVYRQQLITLTRSSAIAGRRCDAKACQR